MPKVPEWTPEKWEKWAKDKKYAEERVEHLEDELDKTLDGGCFDWWMCLA